MYVYMRLDSLVVSDLAGQPDFPGTMLLQLLLYVSVIPAFVVAELTTGTERMRRCSL